MKIKSILTCLMFVVCTTFSVASKAQAVNVQDSLALVDLYNSTNGPSWIKHTNWLTINPVKKWYGVIVSGTSVSNIQLYSNNLNGNIPSSLGNLTNLNYLDLDDNQLSGTIPPELGNLSFLTYINFSFNQLKGNIPTEFGNLKNLFYLYLGHNKLSGAIPSAIAELGGLKSGALNLSYNSFTFNGMESIAQSITVAVYDPQKRIPINFNNNTLSVSAGGTLSNNTYRWVMVGQTGSTEISGDSVFHPTQSGTYFAKISNSICTQLILKSDKIIYTAPVSLTNNIASSANTAQPLNKSKSFSIYPNPAKDILNIQTNTSAAFTLITEAGKILIIKNINGNGTMNISGIAAGLYFLKNTTTGQIQKVIITK